MIELRASLDVPLGESAPTVARKAVRHMLTAWGLTEPHWLGRAELVVSELVSNAVRHGGGCIELTMQSHEGDVTIFAADESSVIPRRRQADGAPGGHGLMIIESCSAGWGVENFNGGKRVWVKLHPHPAPHQDG